VGIARGGQSLTPDQQGRGYGFGVGRALLLVAAVAALAATAALSAGAGRQAIRAHVVTAKLDQPVDVTAPRSEKNKLYVVEQPGRIRVIVNGKLRAAPFLDIRRLVLSGGEQGLLGLAFHPDYAKNRRLYVNYTDRPSGDTRVVEYRADKAGNHVIPSTRRQLFVIDQPYANHNGGDVVFGPDKLLYVGMGDGGSGGDPQNRAQNLSSLLGKLLKINPTKVGAKPVIAGYGLRNPWRFSFDRVSGDLWIGDVGQNAWEEVDFTPKSSPGVENYGWNVYEGFSTYDEKQPNTAGHLVQPVHVYPHSDGISITGGFVYRGTKVPSLKGRYVFGDFGSGTVWSLKPNGSSKATDVRQETNVPQLSSFGEDAAGELYATSLTGRLYRLAGS
jgi:glucose/arabinose dehydrogenase